MEVDRDLSRRVLGAVVAGQLEQPLRQAGRKVEARRVLDQVEQHPHPVAEQLGEVLHELGPLAQQRVEVARGHEPQLGVAHRQVVVGARQPVEERELAEPLARRQHRQHEVPAVRPGPEDLHAALLDAEEAVGRVAAPEHDLAVGRSVS